jgi:hypothetical protein
VKLPNLLGGGVWTVLNISLTQTTGHFLLDCPTNMVEMPINNQRILKSVNAFQDPSFDKKPPMTYTCSLCKKSGEHWFSLCPKNTSRDSITQKRLAAGIQAAGVGALQRDGKLMHIFL